MTEFRPCPTFPGYETTVCGIVRRAEAPRVFKSGLTGVTPSKVLKRVGRTLEYVTLKGVWIKVVALVEDAWSVTIAGEDRPTSSYRDGRVITVHEWAEIMRRS